MLSVRAFAQRINALCEWFERFALCLMIRMVNQGVMCLVEEKLSCVPCGKCGECAHVKNATRLDICHMQNVENMLQKEEAPRLTCLLCTSLLGKLVMMCMYGFQLLLVTYKPR
ncbi:hypothetical protein LR48_Vigan10g070200 [Vigna angularis]|uniref:Uncharacterized protein n=1 Tax=Phaseolus angularis TaxID=3914 RepID=A0A0L9VIB6_PHAAN|nr:hypothetical protein LR48_Vigan10g070200 [Vigna angularis]